MVELKEELESELAATRDFEEEYATLDCRRIELRKSLHQAREKAKVQLKQEAELRKSCNRQFVLQKRRVYESWRAHSTPNDQRRAFFLKAEDITQEPTQEALSLYRDQSRNLNQRLEIAQQSHLVEACHEKLKFVQDALQNPAVVHNRAFVLSLAQQGIQLDPATPQSRIADFLQSQKIVVASECARATEEMNKSITIYEHEWGQPL